jgi:hypothetical protein
MSDNTSEVTFDREYPLRGGGKVKYYEVEGWHMEVSFDEDGNLDPDCDVNLEDAERAILAWQAWTKFVKEKGWEND